MTAALLAGATTLVAVRDPHVVGSWGLCPVLVLTGHPCPLCGGLRAVHDLAHGDLASALSSNAVVVLAVPFVVTGWLSWARRRFTGTGREEPPLPSTTGAWALLAVVIAFGVLRDTRWVAGLGP